MEGNEFGLYIKELRMKKKMTIRQLEMKSGLSNGYLSHVERGIRGVPKPESIKKLAAALGVPFEEMMIKAGHIREQKDVVFELSTKLIEEMRKNKQIDLSKFEDYEFEIDGVKLTKEYMEKLLTVARQFLPPPPPPAE